ncbi:UNVERIFIED_CONTAM: hypothetical protein Slati_2683000 [Sesamum latifolium]|uniref:Aminotransferase-like plant mobile domain-containing protein n=1 Tax=Sesamum latifolium TaxID=2727402 RepID=A0AAW2VZL3_9LAMI
MTCSFTYFGRSIIEGDAKWDGDLQFTEIFITPKGIGSGLKMCLAGVLRSVVPLTNTLLTSAGELSISLWDLHDLAGLPMTGCLYDEVVPSALELTGADEKEVDSFPIPASTYFMLTTYFKLMIDAPMCLLTMGEVLVQESYQRWSIAEEALSEKLCIEENLKEEVYLAAYLACWLCTFVLSGKDVNSIRPSTFKMASMMANGRRVSLAIPVLTSIYEGLNIIASSSRPARTSPSFPVHFVYAWLASYFKTHYPIWQGLRGPKMTKFSGEGGTKYYDPQEARKRIHKAEFVFWACNMIVKNRPFKFIDNGDAEELDHEYSLQFVRVISLSVKVTSSLLSPTVP